MTTNNFTLEELEIIKEDSRFTFIKEKCKVMIEALKPRAVLINGIEVPAPVREKLGIMRTYYYPAAYILEGYDETLWNDTPFDNHLLAAGQIHITAEAAQKHNEALVSFTKLRSLASKQEPLGEPFQTILNDNMKDLYES